MYSHYCVKYAGSGNTGQLIAGCKSLCVDTYNTKKHDMRNTWDVCQGAYEHEQKEVAGRLGEYWEIDTKYGEETMRTSDCTA